MNRASVHEQLLLLFLSVIEPVVDYTLEIGLTVGKDGETHLNETQLAVTLDCFQLR